MKDSDPELTKVHVDLPNHWWHKGESLWARPLGDDAYEIDNIPFCAYALNCGDVVLATPDAPDLKPEVRSVLRRSGNQTMRMSFCDQLSKEEQQPVIAALESMGTEVERVTAQFVCISVPPTTDLQAVRGYLVAQESAGILEYETCEERVAGSFDDRPRGPESGREA
jgi:hypothetical protein